MTGVWGDEELFTVPTRLSSERFKSPIFACTNVTPNINLNGAHSLSSPVMLLRHGQSWGTDVSVRLFMEIQNCFPSAMELVLTTLNLVCHLSGALHQRRLECTTLLPRAVHGHGLL